MACLRSNQVGETHGRPGMLGQRKQVMYRSSNLVRLLLS